MLSYRHSFHAGNFADLLKHLVLVYLVDYLNKKEKPYACLDTHSGAGLYSLHGSDSQKTGEYQQGIARLIAAPTMAHPLLKRFRALIQEFNPTDELTHYPGSPALIHQLIRAQDRLLLNELHPRDWEQLAQLMQDDSRVRVEQQDAYARLKASLPFPERRGLILIDPSYEIKEEYQRVVHAISQAYRRMATGVYALWYPVVQRQQVEQLCKDLKATGIPRLLRIEHCISADTSGFGMTGSGMLIINPPYTLAEDFTHLLPELDCLLAQDKTSHYQVQWLNQEDTHSNT